MEEEEFICPNCKKIANWVENPYDSYDGFCIHCNHQWIGKK